MTRICDRHAPCAPVRAARRAIAALLAAAVICGCARHGSPAVVAERLEDITVDSLREDLTKQYRALPWVDTVVMSVVRTGFHERFLDFDFRANLLVQGRDSSVLYRVSVEPTGGRYPEDYYRIKLTRLPYKEGDVF